MRAIRRVRKAGFTLIEVLIAITILVFITSLVYSSLSSTLTLTELAQSDEETINSARVTMSRLSRELEMAYLDPRLYRTARRAAAGGTVIETYKTMFKAEDSNPVDKLTFSTFGHVRLYHGSTEADQAEVSYWGEPDEENPGLFKLMHRESLRIDAEPEEGGTVEVLARGVQELSLTYYDVRKEEWVETWDAEDAETRNRLPKGVAIGLVLEDPDGVVHRYRTRILVPMFKPLPPSLSGRPPTAGRTGAAGGAGGSAGGTLNPLGGR